MNRLTESVLWLVGLGGLGYVLMQVTTPDETKMRKILVDAQPQYQSEAQRKKQAIVDILKGAAEGREPIYRKSREELDALRESYIGKK